jgi:terminase large subunit-like protein
LGAAAEANDRYAFTALGAHRWNKRDPRVPEIVVWEPQPRQALMISCPVFEVLYGGARGGGKTDATLGDFVNHGSLYGRDAIGLCVRRQRTHLVEMIERSKQIYGPIGAKYHAQDKMWRFPNGARLTFAYLENDSDAEAYQGWNTTRVYVEEMGQFPNPTPIFKLMATLRSPNPAVKVGFRATANPGGPGHLWCRQRYIDPSPQGMKIIKDTYTNPFTGKSHPIERVFIPSKVVDNKYCNTAQYISQLQLSAGRRLLQAWLYGDWSIIEGAFFEEWDEEKHVIKPFVIPAHWTRFCSADWGSAAPFAIHWWAVVPDESEAFSAYFDIRANAPKVPEKLQYRNDLPAGSIVCYREWYGSPNHSNQGLKMTAEEVANGIVERERYEPRDHAGRARITYRVIDPDACKDKGGPSIAERMARSPNYVFWQPADNMRVGRRGNLGGWDSLRARLKGNSDGRPMIYFFDNCEDAIRTLPVMQHDPDNPEDVMEGEDHAPDSVRYACMSRPFAIQLEQEDKTPRILSIGPLNQIIINDVMEEMNEKPNRISFHRIR